MILPPRQIWRGRANDGAERAIYAAYRAGQEVTPEMTVATISKLAELNAYHVGLSERQALTTEAMRAIRDRQDALLRGRA